VKRRIVLVNSMYSEGMGYLENCLPAALARLGHDVHVVTSTFNQYANEPMYDAVYSRFIGPRKVPPGTIEIDGYRVVRLDATLVRGYVRIKGLTDQVRSIAPDAVYTGEVASLETFALVFGQPRRSYRLFCGTHQTASVLKPWLRHRGRSRLRRAVYWLTRTMPTGLASRAAERVYAQAPDCLEIAATYYGVPRRLLVLRTLATDTERFHPVTTDEDHLSRTRVRESLGFAPDDVVCVYSGRFAAHKNPLLLAQAIERLNDRGYRYRGLFIGDGPQAEAIEACRGCRVVAFVRHRDLPSYYRASDVAVWPRQESMSMLDAAASALPVIVSDTMSDPSRIAGNGVTYEEDSVESLMSALEIFADREARRRLGSVGRERMVAHFTWLQFARELEADIARSLAADDYVSR
jgi:glycosyltransferase involved in cell wall biosynthesis